MKDILIHTDGGMLRVYMCQPARHKAELFLVQLPILNDTGGMSHSSSTQNSDSNAESEKVPDSDAVSDAEPD